MVSEPFHNSTKKPDFDSNFFWRKANIVYEVSSPTRISTASVPASHGTVIRTKNLHINVYQQQKSPRTPNVRIVFCLQAVKMSRVVRKVPRFGAGILWGTIPSGFPVFWSIVPGSSRNGHGTNPNLWLQKKLVKLWQSTQDTWLRFAKFFREFLSYSALDLLRDLGDVILS